MITLYLDSNNAAIHVNPELISWYAMMSDAKEIMSGIEGSDDAVMVMMADKTVFVVKYDDKLFKDRLDEVAS